jgi:uncharacterized protein YfiM (DUF2279 family)
MKTVLKLTASLVTLAILSSCGGGGGGTTPATQPLDIVKYPYETVYGDACRTSEPTPGCTFSRTTGARVTVSADPTYDSQGFGSDDLWYVKFDSSGRAQVFDDLGNFKYNANPSEFAGYVPGTISTIGVGTTGFFWENVSSKTYWFGKNGVLYSANTSASNFGQAINNKNAGKSSSVDSLSIKSDKNKALIKAGADKLVKQYGLTSEKAVAVASALNSWAVMGAERGKVTTQDMDKTFKTVFGVQFNEALAAFKDFQNGDTTGARELTNRSATTLGLKPDQAQAFVKGMYKGAIEKMGYKTTDIKW